MALTLPEILRRFRPAVAPGPAAPPGVPADRVAEVQAELAGVFAALEPTVAAAGQVRDQARTAADARRQRGLEEAEGIVAEARGRLDATRTEAASGHLAALDEERARIEAEARAEVERVRRVADERRHDVVARVMAGVRATAGLAAPAAATGDRGRGEVAR